MSERVRFVGDEGGFTTPAAAVALLLVCSLLFMSLHGYRVGTRSGQIQYVADAGALAADNVVAEFVTAGQVVDALLLSCSLLGLTVYAVSAVAAFIPGGAGVAADLAQVGSKILKFRDRIADSAIKGLDQAQKALPALAALRASACVEANAAASGIDYKGFAVTFPLQGVQVSLADDTGVEEAAEDIESRQDDIQRDAVEQQRKQEQLDQAKHDAWYADCGSSGMNMRERAARLAGLSGASNPTFSSPDTWSFAVALQRAKSYYAARYEAEPGSSFDGSPELVSESVARKRFYEYALSEVSKGSVSYTATGLELPELKPLARNNQQVKQTVLYTERVYPVSLNGSERVIHGYAGCPRYQEGSPAGTASAQDEDTGNVRRCDVCKFSALTLGRVPSASTSIDNGFEYYYRKVVEAANSYRDAAADLEELNNRLENHEQKIEDDIAKAVESLAGSRYDPQPPGRYGCVCIVYAPETGLGSLPFLREDGRIASRVAISGATLAADPGEEGGNVVSDIANGLMPESMPGSGLLHIVLGAWGSLLKAYTGGVESVDRAFQSVLGAIPLVGTDLSSWAAEGFQDALTSAGLAPADLSTYKPVLVNTSHVLERDGGAAAQALLSAKRAADAYGAASVGDFQVLVDQLDSMGALAEAPSGDMVIAELPFSSFGSGVSDDSLSLSAPSDLSASFDSLRSELALLDSGGSS